MSGKRRILTNFPDLPDAIGESETFLNFQEELSRAANIDRPVMLVGERGTGKELAARKLHYLSPRWENPLVILNAAALPPTLIEAELFGAEAGAYTGAVGGRVGRFEAADGGTLFLDEIALVPLRVQEKILRVVEYNTFERLGSSSCISADTRIIAATNADLKALSESGRFKQDLLDRLSFEVLYVPPLRERQGDIPLLTKHFAAHMAAELGGDSAPRFSSTAMRALEDYPWPGNIRELKNVVERAVYRAMGDIIEEIEFDPFISPYPPPKVTPAPLRRPAAGDAGSLQSSTAAAEAKGRTDYEALRRLPFREAVAEFEIMLLREALGENRFNQRRAAETLGLSYHQFRGLYRKYGRRLAE